MLMLMIFFILPPPNKLKSDLQKCPWFYSDATLIMMMIMKLIKMHVWEKKQRPETMCNLQCIFMRVGGWVGGKGFFAALLPSL